MIKWLYRNVDMVMVSAEDAASQFREIFDFGNKVTVGRYASDLDNYFLHPIRKAKAGLTLIFANRLTYIYQPLLAIEIFFEVLKRYPSTMLILNADGELRNECEALIVKLGLQNRIQFLDNIKAWDDLPKIYEKSDVLILPAKFSNGNFTILEAMASGMGIVISDQVLGIGKMINDGINGFVTGPTVLDFANKICNFYLDERLFEKFGTVNKEIVRPYGMEGTAKFFYEIIKEKLNIEQLD
ncbi:MAG: glycosyltransferase [Ignavibacteria bacterium]|nr:glycosyltransferase [Ignavibacteria bacterium]